MPLINKKPFERIPTPEGISDNDKVFYLEATNEVFLTHEEYYNRVIELNSTIWSCAYTRRTNLTFFEAMESENESLNSLKLFPDFLEKPILYIVKNYTNRGRIEDLINDIYFIMKDRFFISEEVTYAENNRKYPAKIVGAYVLYADQMDPSFLAPSNLAELKEPLLPPAENYRYTLQILDGFSFGDEGLRDAVPPEKLFRSKQVGARQKVKLFLKNSCYMPWPGDRYVVKDAYLADNIVNNLRWNLVMAGFEPICPQTPVVQRGRTPNVMKPGYVEPEKKVRVKKPKRDENEPPKPRGRPPKTKEEEQATPSSNSNEKTPTKKSKSKKKKMSEEKRLHIKQQQAELEFFFSEAKRLGLNVGDLEQEDRLLAKKTVREFKQAVKDAKEKEKELAKEEKLKKSREKATWNKKRDDLMCDDLKPLPRFAALELPPWISGSEFGEYLFVMQFFCTFKEILPLKEIRGTSDIYFSDIVIAMKCNDPQNSPYADLMRVILSVRTDTADEEDGDEADIANRDEVYLINTQNCDPANPSHGEAIREMCALHSAIRKTHGKSVRHLPVDWMTLSEIVRLIFLTAGYYTGMSTHRHRLYNRGNFKGYEDPGYEFRMANPEIMEKLKTQTVFDLEENERLGIMKALILQLLTYSKFRTYIETQHNDVFELRQEVKKLRIWDRAQEQESNSARASLEQALAKGEKREETVTQTGKKLKSHLKAINEGRRYDKQDLDAILLEAVPYSELDLDEIVSARSLQKSEFQAILKNLMEKIFEIHARISDVHLGRDRAYRKYFVFDNLAAIFVENPDETDVIGCCEEASVIEKSEYLQETASTQVLVCSGDMASCSVHGAKYSTRPKWSYISSAEQLDELIQSLNPRGYRESALIEEINTYKTSLVDILADTKQAIETGEWAEMLMRNASNPSDTYNIDWDDEIRDLLLDFEEKIEQGQMGSIAKMHSVDRDEWRRRLKETGDVVGLMKHDLMIGGSVALEIGEEDLSEVRKLAVAFFQIVTSITPKFIRAPFISPNKDENGLAKYSEMFQRWQKSLLNCESHSALSLFLYTVESSIQWDKSRLQGRCRQCRKKGATKELVLCVECDSCYHLTCVNLPSDELAPNDWMCTTCRAQKRKLENEAKRQARAAQLPDTEDELSLVVNSSMESESNETTLDGENSMTRTSSGRAVKRVQYRDDLPLRMSKKRKSNQVVAVTPESASRRPHRTTSHPKFFGDFDENSSSQTDDSLMSDDEDRRRSSRKRSSNKSFALYDAGRGSTQALKEKMVALEALLKETMRQECSWPFLEPVDPKEVPDYYDVIKRPMDLRTMMNKLKQRVYNGPSEVRGDFNLIISNCDTYNEPGSEIHNLSQQLYDYVAQRMNDIIDK